MFAKAMKRCAFAGLVFGALVCCAWMAAPAVATEAPKQRINIPAGDLVASLELLAKQSAIEFIYDADQLKGIEAHSVSGDLTPKEAVIKLLEGTPLVLKEHPSGALLITLPRADGGLEEIVVTGTHIRGEAPTGSALIVYSHSDIEQSGVATLDQFARTVPGNFASVDAISNLSSNIRFSRTSVSNGINAFQGASFNLHGLGPTTTLTLLNGQRLAPGGLDGSFTDISQIPLSAIDRIEVLSNGASAIYGADAVAGVINVITRKDFNGADTSVRYGGSTDGGADEITTSQLLGKSWGTGNLLLNYELDDQHGLNAVQRAYIPDLGGPYSLIPQSRRNSIFLSGSQEWGPKTTISGDVLYSDRTFSDSTTLNSLPGPFTQSTQDSGSAKQLSATAALDRALAGDWHAELSGNYSRNQQVNNATAAIVQGSARLTEAFAQGATPSIIDVNALTQGSLLSIPGGTVKTALGASFRTERFASTDVETALGRITSSGESPSRREVSSLYGEIVAPLIGDANAAPGYRRLDLSLAGRFDHYSDFGSTINPKLGLSWEIIQDLTFKATFGSSFQAPLLNQVHAPLSIETEPLPNIKSASGLTDAIILQGGNLNLRPEKSQSYTAGFDFKPAIAPGSAMTLSFFHIKFTNRITTPPTSSGGNYSLNDPLLVPFITHDPSLATVQSDFDSPAFSGDLARMGPSGVQAIFDDRLTNLSAAIQSGVDLTTQFALSLGPGRLNLSLNVERLFENITQTVYFAPTSSLLNSFAEPPKWKGRAGALWTEGRLTASVSVNYVNSYQNSLFTPSEPIGSWTTGDLYLSYETTDAQPWPLRQVTVSLGISNVTDAHPPRVQIPGTFTLPGEPVIPFDPANASPLGRMISLSVDKRW
jgi:iron complex outermembrane receptor protein